MSEKGGGESKRIMVKNMLRWRRARAFALLLLSVAGLIGMRSFANGGPDGAGRSSRVVVDWHTGLAIHGFDPVAYFTDAKAVSGRPELERTVDGLTWRFRNEGNHAARSGGLPAALRRL